MESAAGPAVPFGASSCPIFLITEAEEFSQPRSMKVSGLTHKGVIIPCLSLGLGLAQEDFCSCNTASAQRVCALGYKDWQIANFKSICRRLSSFLVLFFSPVSDGFFTGCVLSSLYRVVGRAVRVSLLAESSDLPDAGGCRTENALPVGRAGLTQDRRASEEPAPGGGKRLVWKDFVEC